MIVSAPKGHNFIKLVSCSLFLCYTVQAAGLKSTIVRLDKIFAVFTDSQDLKKGGWG